MNYRRLPAAFNSAKKKTAHDDRPSTRNSSTNHYSRTKTTVSAFFMALTAWSLAQSRAARCGAVIPGSLRASSAFQISDKSLFSLFCLVKSTTASIVFLLTCQIDLPSVNTPHQAMFHSDHVSSRQFGLPSVNCYILPRSYHSLASSIARKILLSLIYTRY